MPSTQAPFFPGNQLLLEHASVRAHDGAVKVIESSVAADLSTLDHGWQETAATIRHRYFGDPLVMRLLHDFESLSLRLGNTVKDLENADEQIKLLKTKHWRAHYP